jgi:hypothetical protein
METAKIKEQFESILADVMKINGLPIEQATDVAKVILIESGKDRRTAMIQSKQNGGNPVTGNGSNGNGNQQATDKQKEALKKWRVSFADNLTKDEASRLLDEAIEKKNAKKQ